MIRQPGPPPAGRITFDRPEAGSYRGRDKIRAFLELILDSWEEFEQHIEEVQERGRTRFNAPTTFDALTATGFTGQLVTEYLAAQYKGDATLKWAMAGRSKDKLASVRDAIGAPA